MKLDKYPINPNDSCDVKSLKRKLAKIESSIKSYRLRGFCTKKLIAARAYYIGAIKGVY